MKEKKYALDYFRILLAILVLLYHAHYTAGCRFGKLMPLVNSASVYMAGFFMLSGFLGYYVHRNMEFNPVEIRKYISKKVLALFPMGTVLIVLWYCLSGREVLIRDFVVAFYSLFLIQSSAYTINLDNGIWFFGALFIWQLLTPYLICIIRDFGKKEILISVGFLWILITISFVLNLYYTSMYDNWMFRGEEYILGMLCAKVYCSGKGLKANAWKALLLLAMFFLYIYAVEGFCSAVSGLANQTILDSVGVLFLFVLLLVLADMKMDIRGKAAGFLSFISRLTFQIFVASYPAAIFMDRFVTTAVNGVRISIFILFTIIVALLLYSFQWLMQRIFAKRVGLMIMLDMALVASVMFFLSYLQHRPAAEYDFLSDTVKSEHIQGCYADEGEYAWVSGDFSVLLRSGGTVLSIKAATVYIDRPTTVEVLVNGESMGTMNITNIPTEFIFELNKSSNGKYVVCFESEDTFIPTEAGISQTDNRELLLMLYYIGIKAD